ncbi:hypothetical protein AB0H73_36195 [Streptomyces olivoreticuli]
MLWILSLFRRPAIPATPRGAATTATRTLLPRHPAPRIAGSPPPAPHPALLPGGDELRVRALLHRLIYGGSR